MLNIPFSYLQFNVINKKNLIGLTSNFQQKIYLRPANEADGFI